MKDNQRKEWKDLNKNEKILGMTAVTLILCVLIAFLAWMFIFPSKERTSYSATITGNAAIDPATLRVFIKVRNSGKVAGTPTCTVNATNDRNHYRGTGIFHTDAELKPGDERVINGKLTVTNNGAEYISNVSVDCR